MGQPSSATKPAARPSFVDFISQLDKLRERTARFYRVALHLHSPDSHDWPAHGSDPQVNDRARFAGVPGPQQFADEIRKHVDLAAITDHMKYGFATRVSGGRKDATDFKVLPGIEINFRPEAALGCARVHLLVIMREGTTPEIFSRLFAGMQHIQQDEDRTGQEEVYGIPLKEWVSRVHDQGGICIAAHVENDQGIRCRFRQTSRETLQLFTEGDGRDLERASNIGESFKEYLIDANLDAIEITKRSDCAHYRWMSQKDGTLRSIATVLSFDAHSIEQLARSERVTWVKMTQLGYDGLKIALTFPDTRIRFPEELPTPPSARLLGVQIAGGPFFDNITTAFAENLNCLIGARGSGKSTIVEALRYVFGYNRTLDELEKLAEPIRELQRANLGDSIVRVAYRTAHGDIRILESTFDPKSKYSTKVFMPEGDFVEIADVEASGEYPLRLFGWSEIENLGRSPARQRALLDRLVPGIAAAQAKRDGARSALRENRADVNKALADLSSAFDASGREITRYKEYVADFEKVNTPQVKLLFASLDFAHAKQRVLAQVQKNVDDILKDFGDPEVVSVRRNLPPLLDAGEQELRDWWTTEEMPKLGLISTEQELHRLLREASAKLEAFSDLLRDHGAGLGTEIRDLEDELRAGVSADASMQKVADLRANASKRLKHVSALRDAYLGVWECLADLLRRRTDLTARLDEAQNELAGIRSRHSNQIEERLNEFLLDAMRVSIRFTAGGDTEAFADSVTPFLAAAGRYKARGLPQVVAHNFSPVEFVRLVLKNDPAELAGKSCDVDGERQEFASADATKVFDAVRPFEHDDNADVPIVAGGGKRLNSLLELEETDWDDEQLILLNDRPVNEVSPGQRSSAMLPLIALSENTPLVIDQPEDNLDKRLIGGVLAGVLAQLKERRQIIVCTHDPNIVVGGDAEQVIVLDAVSDRKGTVRAHGSIDNDDIVKTIVDILEGGKEAFETRRKRYGVS